MNGGVYLCDKCGYSIGHFGSEPTNAIACLHCDGWMHLTGDDMSADGGGYKKPNIFWRFLGWLLQPLFRWVDKHSKDDDDDI